MLLNSDMCGKVVAIAGACSFSGASIASFLALKGARLMLGDERLTELHILTSQIADKGGSVQYRATSPMRSTSVDMLVIHTVDAYGHIDVLLNLGADPHQPLVNRLDSAGRFTGSTARFPINTMRSHQWRPHSHS